MTRCKVVYGVLATLALVIASATTFKLVTGECPFGCIMSHLRGEPGAPASAN